MVHVSLYIIVIVIIIEVPGRLGCIATRLQPVTLFHSVLQPIPILVQSCWLRSEFHSRKHKKMISQWAVVINKTHDMIPLAWHDPVAISFGVSKQLPDVAIPPADPLTSRVISDLWCMSTIAAGCSEWSVAGDWTGCLDFHYETVSWIPCCTLDVIQKHPAAEDSDERIGLGSLWKFLVMFRQREGHGSIGSIGWGVLVGWPWLEWLDSATRGQWKRWNAWMKNLDSCFCLQSFVPQSSKSWKELLVYVAAWLMATIVATAGKRTHACYASWTGYSLQ